MYQNRVSITLTVTIQNKVYKHDSWCSEQNNEQVSLKMTNII